MENLRKRLNNKGFTLVELLVVIAIIAVLSVTAYVALGGQTAKARNSRRMQDLSAIQNALEIYFVENVSKYPDQLDDGDPNSSDDDLVPKYMPEVPVDPVTGAIYAYDTNVTNKKYQLGATLEDLTETEPYTAYVIGNNEDDILPQVVVPGGSCSGAPADGDTDCVPMDIWN